MPELAEVEYYRKQWDPGLGECIAAVLLHPKARIFRQCDTSRLVESLTGAKLTESAAAGKQMVFQASGGAWLGLHLGMTGKLSVEPASFSPGKADHLVLVQAKRALVFSDHRMFGSVQFAVGKKAPEWWSRIAPPIVSSAFTRAAVKKFLQRRKRTPIKAVLLMQERFPGVGNWMADEILWRAAVHPRQLAGTLTTKEITAVHRAARWVCRESLRIIGRDFGDPPKTWLFPHRWRAGGLCPRTGARLIREVIGGRMTCWSPGRQKLHP